MTRDGFFVTQIGQIASMLAIGSNAAQVLDV